MPGPPMFHCGGAGEMPCPPVTAVTEATLEAVYAYGHLCFEAGKVIGHAKGHGDALEAMMLAVQNATAQTL
jgi:hypothetical protein